jgi:hypothetical protein
MEYERAEYKKEDFYGASDSNMIEWRDNKETYLFVSFWH